MNSELPIGNVLFRQQELAPGAKLTRAYDLIMAGLSWEDRSTFGFSRLTPSVR
jgi:hypothetical protein